MSPPSRDGVDWLMLLTLVGMWGTSFYFVEIALGSISPLTLVALRLLLAAVLLCGAMAALGMRPPGSSRAWRFFAVLALIGNCVPFLLIAWGQQRIDSGLAGIVVGFMPIATLVLAHFYVEGERITRAKLAGFVLGLAGLVALLGPGVLSQWDGLVGVVLGQLACLVSAVCYAGNSVLTKRMPHTQALVAAACTTALAALIMTATALAFDDRPLVRPDVSALAATLWLGVGPTALATLVYFRLIARAGPTFMSTANYLNPLLALAAGVLLLGEPLRMNALIGLGLLLSGIALSTRSARVALPRR